MRRFLFAALIAGLAGPAAAQDVTQARIESAVEKIIVPKLTEGGHAAVSLAPIVWADTLEPAPAGAGLSQALANALTRSKVGVTAGARAVLGGTLARVTDERSDPPAPALKLVLRLEMDAKPACEIPLLLLMEGWLPFDPVEVAIPPAATPLERVEILKKARETPPPPQAGPVRWSPDGTVGIKMLLAKAEDVRQARQTKRPEAEVGKLFAARAPDGKGRVTTATGEVARFELINKNAFAVAGMLRISGVDWCEFANPADPAATGGTAPQARERLLVVVPANQSITVRGFYRDDTSSLSFDVRCLPAVAAGKQADAGVAAYHYAFCWMQGQAPPPGEEGTAAQLAGQRIVPGAVQADRFERVERIVGRDRGVVRLVYGAFPD